MKNLALILAFFALVSCEKEPEFEEYNLIVSISNTVPYGNSNPSPLGYTFEYMKNGKLIKGGGNYVGEGFKMYWNSNMQLYIKAESEHLIQIKVFREGIDTDSDNPWKYNKGYQLAIIN